MRCIYNKNLERGRERDKMLLGGIVQITQKETKHQKFCYMGEQKVHEIKTCLEERN